MATTFPIYPAFTDDFADGLADALWTDTGETITEAGGVCTIAPTGAYAQRYLAALDTNGGVFSADVAPSFAAAAPGQVARAAVAMGSETRQLFVGKKRTDAGWLIVVEEDDGTVHYSVATDNAAARFEIRRAGALVSFGIVEEAGVRELASIDDWSGDASFGLHAAQNYVAGYAEFDDASFASTGVRVDRIDSRVLGQHLANTIAIEGAGFVAGATASLVGPDGGESCTVTVDSAAAMTIVTPLVTATGWRSLVIAPFASSFAVTIDALHISGEGYRILRSLLPPGRYTPDATNPFNVVVAAAGRVLDQDALARRTLREREIFPQLADALLHRHEQRYGIAVNPTDSLTDRRARVDVARRLSPSLATEFLNNIIDAVLSGVEITENSPYDDYGDIIWQYQVYEPAPGTLSHATRAQLERSLIAAGPAWTRPAIGALGFVVGSSAVGGDFLNSEV